MLIQENIKGIKFGLDRRKSISYKLEGWIKENQSRIQEESQGRLGGFELRVGNITVTIEQNILYRSFPCINLCVTR